MRASAKGWNEAIPLKPRDLPLMGHIDQSENLAGDAKGKGPSGPNRKALRFCASLYDSPAAISSSLRVSVTLEKRASMPSLNDSRISVGAWDSIEPFAGLLLTRTA